MFYFSLLEGARASTGLCVDAISSSVVPFAQFSPTCGRHAFARSVTVARSSAVQVSYSRRQERRWAVVCRSPQSQSTDWASSRQPHLIATVFARPTPVRSRLRAPQQSQSSPDPAGKDSATSSGCNDRPLSGFARIPECS